MINKPTETGVYAIVYSDGSVGIGRWYGDCWDFFGVSVTEWHEELISGEEKPVAIKPIVLDKDSHKYAEK